MKLNINKIKTFKELLLCFPNGNQACNKAIIWAEDKTIEDIVKTVHRGDWLLWLAKTIDLPIKTITLAKAKCVKTVIHLMKDQRSINAVNVAERFGLEQATLSELNNAADAAYAAYANAYPDANTTAYATYATYATYAAYAAAYAADANPTATTIAAYAAAYAANAAAYAAYDDSDADNAKVKNQLETANICREVLGELIIEKINFMLK